MPHHVITKAEAEYALDRVEFDRLMAKHGKDTVLTWWYQTTLHLPSPDRPEVSTITDPRR